MGYVIAAYGVTVVALVAYGIHLARERARLARDVGVAIARDVGVATARDDGGARDAAAPGPADTSGHDRDAAR